MKRFILKQFKAILDNNHTTDFNTAKENFNKLLKKGILVDKDVVVYLTNRLTDDIIKTFGVSNIGLNSSFYKTFEEMKSKDELELRIDQLLHYMSTYGEVDVLRNGETIFEPTVFDKTLLDELNNTFTKIELITKEELHEKVKLLLESGIALKSDDVDNLYNLVVQYNYELDVNDIQNREFLTIYSSNKFDAPRQFDDFMRILLYMIDGQTMLIQSKSRLRKINQMCESVQYNYYDSIAIKEKSNRAAKFLNSYISKYGIAQSSQHLRRYKKTLLVLRKLFKVTGEYETVSNINAITRLNKRLNVPKVFPVFSKLTDEDVTVEDIQKASKDVTIYQLIRAYGVLSQRILEAESDSEEIVNLYKIRNGHSFIKTSNNLPKPNKVKNLKEKRKVIIQAIKQLFGDSLKGKVILVGDERVNIKLPTSAKSNFGNLPDYSSVELDGKFQVGIYWTGVKNWDNHIDIDLHVNDLNGRSFGWNSSYRAKDEICYSGDMTHLNQDGFAAEYFEFGDLDTAANITVQPYAVPSDYEYQVVIAKSNNRDVKQMVNGKDVILTNKMMIEETRGSGIAVVVPNGDGTFKVILSDISSYQGKVPNKEAMQSVIETIIRKEKSMMSLGVFAKIMGMDVIHSLDELGEDDERTVIDLSPNVITTDKLVELLTV